MQSYGSTALCSFCSREDNAVKVVCKKYCLICKRCQLLPATRQLILDHYYTDEIDNANHNNNNHTTDNLLKNDRTGSPGECPICSSPMTKNMYFVMRSIDTSSKDVEKNSMFLELDLGFKPNIFMEFLQYFR